MSNKFVFSQSSFHTNYYDFNACHIDSGSRVDQESENTLIDHFCISVSDHSKWGIQCITQHALYLCYHKVVGVYASGYQYSDILYII